MRVIEQARAVEARLRGYSNTTMNRFGHEGCDVINALITELEAAQADAELWRAYKARKDTVIAAGMGRNPMRSEVKLWLESKDD